MKQKSTRESLTLTHIINLVKAGGTWHVIKIAEVLGKSKASIACCLSQYVANYPNMVKVAPATYMWQDHNTTHESFHIERSQAKAPVSVLRKHIKWTKEENEELATGLYLYWKKHPEEGITAGLFNRVMHRTIIDTRWKKCQTLLSVKSIVESAAHKMRALIELGENPPETIREVTLKEEIDIPKLLSTTPMPLLFMELGNRFEAVERANQVLVANLSKTQTAEEAQFQRDLARQTTPVENIVRPPRVWLVGPLNNHFQELTARLSGMHINLVGMSDKDKRPSAQQIPRSMDYYVLDTKFISHSWTETVESIIPKDKIIKRRGIHEIREWLLDLAMSKPQSL